VEGGLEFVGQRNCVFVRVPELRVLPGIIRAVLVHLVPCKMGRRRLDGGGRFGVTGGSVSTNSAEARPAFMRKKHF
jgi:hypothetical protein